MKLLVVLVTLLATAIYGNKVLAAQDSDQECPDGWSGYNGKCYKMFSFSSGRGYAVQFCHDEEAHLATIPDPGTNSFIAGLLSSTAGYWIGLSDIQLEGRFKWDDGNLVNYTNWATPRSYRFTPATRDCVIIQGGFWVEVSCYKAARAFVCQKTCPKDWIYQSYTRKCYQLSKEKLDWNSARAECGKKSARLADLTYSPLKHSIKQLTVRRGITGDYFIGRIGPTRDGAFLWLGDNSQNDPNYENCYMVTLNRTFSSDEYSCKTPHRYICERTHEDSEVVTDIKVVAPVHTAQECPDDWSGYNGKCFKKISHIGSRGFAVQYCHDEEAHLATIPDPGTNSFIAGLLSSTGSYWIGLNDQKVEGKFMWEDGTQVNYTNWATPRSYGYTPATRDCVIIQGGFWVEVSCSKLARYYVCQKTCPSDWIYQSATRKCYQYSKEKLDWNSARAECERKGSGLADLTFSPLKFSLKVLSSRMGIAGDYFINWTGPSRDGSFLWSGDNSQNDPKRNNCYMVTLNRVFSSDDYSCNTPQRYICEL